MSTASAGRLRSPWIFGSILKTAVFLGSLFGLGSSALAEPKRVAELTYSDNRLLVERVVSHQGIVWGMDFIDSDSLLFTDRNGKIKSLEVSTGLVKEFGTVPQEVLFSGQGGFFDIRLSPRFSETREIFMTSSRVVGEKATTVLMKSKLGAEDFEPWQDIFLALPLISGRGHFGGRIAFGENSLFLSVGDRGERQRAQDLSNHIGKVLRFRLDGSTPTDNPFLAQSNAQPEIWSYGHRNPQGLVYSNSKKSLFLSEHGPRGGDELNLVKKGKNYGWPVVSFGREYNSGRPVGEGTHKPGMEPPFKQYTPSIAPSGLDYYDHDRMPYFNEGLFLGALAHRHLGFVALDESEQTCEKRLLESFDERVRSVRISPDGLIYFGTDSGNIYRIRPAGKK